MSAQSSHQVAVETAHEFFRRVGDMRLSPTDTIISFETFMAVAVAFITQSSTLRPEMQLAYAQEIIETMTERAHSRVSALLVGKRS